MDPVLIMNLYLFLCALAGSVYGIVRILGRKKALYLRMVTLGVLCMTLSRLYQVVFLLTQGSLREGFHVGVLGTVGSFMFLFSANFGQMDSLVDDGTARFRRVRLLSFAAPAFILALYLVFLLPGSRLEPRIVQGVVTLFIMQCAYFSFKHLIIYDVDLGIIQCLRGYNALVLAYCVLSMLEMIGLTRNVRPLYYAACALIGVFAVVLLPILKKGAEKWTI